MKKIYLFPIVIEPCEEGGYFAKCLTLQGCHAEGETYAEVINNIQDVIRLHIQCRKDHGEFLPAIIAKSERQLCLQVPIPVAV